MKKPDMTKEQMQTVIVDQHHVIEATIAAQAAQHDALIAARARLDEAIDAIELLLRASKEHPTWTNTRLMDESAWVDAHMTWTPLIESRKEVNA